MDVIKTFFGIDTESALNSKNENERNLPTLIFYPNEHNRPTIIFYPDWLYQLERERREDEREERIKRRIAEYNPIFKAWGDLAEKNTTEANEFPGAKKYIEEVYNNDFEKIVRDPNFKQRPLFIPKLITTAPAPYKDETGKTPKYKVDDNFIWWWTMVKGFLPSWITKINVAKKSGNYYPIINWTELTDTLVCEFPVRVYPELAQGMEYVKEHGVWNTYKAKDAIKTSFLRKVQSLLRLWGFSESKRINEGFRETSKIMLSHPYVYQTEPSSPARLMRRGKVAFKNLTFDLTDGSLNKHKMGDYLLNYHDYDLLQVKDGEYAVETNAMLEEMLDKDVELGVENNQVLAAAALSQKSVTLMKEYIGYMFYNSYEEVPNKFMILVGSGGNGKSTLVNLITDWYLDCRHNDNVISIEPKRLADPSDRFVLSSLYGKEAAVDSDIGTDLLKSMSRIKKLTGGDSLPIEFKHGGFMNLKCYAKLLFSANDLPPISSKEVGEALADRALVVPFFNKNTRTEDRDFWKRHDMKKIRKERDIFVWECLHAFMKVMQRNAFTKSPEVERATKNWLNNNDTLKGWLDTIDTSQIHRTSRGIYFLDKKDAYRDYTIYCDKSGFNSYSINNWVQELENKFDFYKGSGRDRCSECNERYTSLRSRNYLRELIEQREKEDELEKNSFGQ